MLPRSYKRGTMIFTRTDAAEGLYVVRQGGALFCIDSENGRRLLLKIIRPNELFGETIAIDAQPAPVSVEARSDLLVSLIPAREVARLGAEHPSIERALARVASANLRKLIDVLEEVVLMPLRERTEACLERLVRENGSTILDITQSELATMVGASRQAVNQVLANLGREGVVRRSFCEISYLGKAQMASAGFSKPSI